jgi:hypothetical protein
MNHLPSIDSILLVCVGGGRIGSDAALLGKGRGWSVVVIDRDPTCYAKGIADEILQCPPQKEFWKQGRITLALGDATEVLLDIIEKRVPEYVVPGASGHLLAKLSVSYLRRRGFRLIPDSQSSVEVARQLPGEIIQVHDEENGLIVVSRMPLDRECMDDCKQPFNCPVTGDVISSPMHEIINNAIRGRTDREVIAVTSWLGHYGVLKGDIIEKTLDVLQGMGEGELLGIATSCRCHGILNVLRAFKKS